MGMFAFRLTLLFCSLTIYKSLYAASVLETSSDLWRSWLLNETEDIPSQQGPPPSRRITPKSVFIAPIFDKCPAGTRLDAMGNCVKIVSIQIDRWENLVNKLNAAFAAPSQKPIAMLNETTTTTTAKAPPSAITTTTTTTTPPTTRITSTTITTTTTTTTTTSPPHISTAEVDVPSSTLPARGGEQPNNITYVQSAVDTSGPFQLSIPLSPKNSSSEEITDAADSWSSFVQSNLTTNFFNESGVTTTTEAENPIEFSSYKYDAMDTTISPQTEVAFSTVYTDTNTAESVASVVPDVEYDTEMTTESTTTTLSDFSTVTAPSTPKKYYIHRRPTFQQQQTSQPERATRLNPNRAGELLNEPKVTVTPVANLIYSYTSGDILKIPPPVPVRFPEVAYGNNKSSPDRVAPNRNGAFSATNTSDINDTTSAVSDSISNSNKLILSSNSAKNDLYQKLPASGKTRPKCDPTTGYGDCAPPSKLDSLIGSQTEKTITSYLVNTVNRGGSAPPVTTIIRFPGMQTKGTSLVRFPGSGNGDGVADQQFKPSSKVDETVAFPEMDIGAASRYWDSNRYPASYWNPWDASKPHFVRIWPSNNVPTPVTTTYNLGSDINYNYRSQADYS